jgi:hypothetical protein
MTRINLTDAKVRALRPRAKRFDQCGRNSGEQTLANLGHWLANLAPKPLKIKRPDMWTTIRPGSARKDARVSL